jgi:hypothetical protein
MTMNAEPENSSSPSPELARQSQIPVPDPDCGSNPPASHDPEITPGELDQPSQQPPALRRSRGKIARLSKATRDKLNSMLRDGLKYDHILAKLGDEAKGISARNISSWHTSPAYQHWSLEQDWLQSLRVEQESAFDLLDDFDASSVVYHN